MTEEYIKARRAGEKEYRKKLIKGEYPYLPALDYIIPGNDSMAQINLGIMDIPVEMIAGTKTLARQNSFAANFMPLLEPDSEFGMKWSSLFKAQMDEGFTSPIKVYEYLHRFYVQEGNKRVSVSRFLDMPLISAEVIRITPAADVLEAEPSYAEFLDFWKVCPLYGIECSTPGSYREIAELLGKSIDPDSEPWPEETVKSLRSSYERFSEMMLSYLNHVSPKPLGDAFLVYLRIYVKDALEHQPGKELDRRIKKIHKELLTAYNEENSVALVESSEDALNAGSIITKTGSLITGPDSLIGKVLQVQKYSEKNPLKAAFIYDKSPDESNWVYNHETGRHKMESGFNGLVATENFVIGDSDFDEKAAAAVDWGADIVFTTSPKLMADTLRAAIEHEDVIFLNCSVNLAHQAVRTYYAKLYEAKFLAGVVAGITAAADGSHIIGYCSDYPIYGTVAGINAFAIGAAMIDPQVKIWLEWSSRQDNNWWWSMVDRGIHVISAVDSMHNTDGSNAYGVCYVEKVEPGEGNDLSKTCRISNLAAPIWKWGRLYEIIIRTVLEGKYHASLVDHKDRATNYWWGMISGVVDIELSDQLSPYTRQLVNILRNDIISGNFNPFDGCLKSQTGTVRDADGIPLTSKDIITMDWLNENIIGEIPAIDVLTDTGKETVSVSGVKSVKKEESRC